MRIPYIAISVAAALGLAASALPAAAGTAGTPSNPEGGAGPSAGGPSASRANRNAAMPDYDTQGQATTNGSGSSFPPQQPSRNAGSISHPGKSFTNPEGGAPQTVGPNAGRAAREKSMGDFPTGAPK